MNRWLIAPLLCCAMTVPSAAWAQPSSPPEATKPAPEAVAAPSVSGEATPEGTAQEPTLGTVEPSFEPSFEPSVEAAQTGPVAPAPPPPLVAAAPLPPPSAAPPPGPRGPVLNKHAEPLLAVGLGGFAGLYLLTAYAGAATIDKAKDISGRDYDGLNEHDGQMTRNRGRALLIPVVGPFIATRFTNSARRRYWQVFNGGLQVGTLAMAIIGTRMYAKHRRAKRRAQVTAAASPEGAQVGMTMRF